MDADEAYFKEHGEPLFVSDELAVQRLILAAKIGDSLRT